MTRVSVVQTSHRSCEKYGIDCEFNVKTPWLLPGKSITCATPETTQAIGIHVEIAVEHKRMFQVIARERANAVRSQEFVLVEHALKNSDQALPLNQGQQTGFASEIAAPPFPLVP